ncbi:MAG: rRNA pseudouridine synthase [Mollicutes bacterium PWAP]|nr:rRNA pseudouridine synthase [Mollicutes bacterium PWAP]
MNNTEKLQKIIAYSGLTSRRKAEFLINEGKVKVDGKVASLGDRASKKQNITVNGVPIVEEQKVYYLLNKPDGVITSASDDRGRVTVLDLTQIPERVFPVGRLDYNTKGTLLLTNDGDLTHKLTHPRYEVKRVYKAKLNKVLSFEELEFLNGGSVKVNGKYSIQTVTLDEKRSYVVTLSVGSYHHVKLLFENVDANVNNLTRIEYAGISHVGNLSKGQYRKLTPKEIKKLKLIANGIIK